jgi:hypothetical protein
VTVSVHEAEVKWKPLQVRGHKFYRVPFRIRKVREGMCEKFEFFLSKTGKPVSKEDINNPEAVLRGELELFDAPAIVTMEGTPGVQRHTIRAMKL